MTRNQSAAAGFYRRPQGVPMFTLPNLPYEYDALSPVISEETMHFHHDKHHATYIKTLNTLLETSGQSFDTLETVVGRRRRQDARRSSTTTPPRPGTTPSSGTA